MLRTLLVFYLFIGISINPQGFKLQADDSKPVSEKGKDSTDRLSGFSARIKDKKIHLNWLVTNPKEVYYYIVFVLNPKTKNYEPVDNSDNRMKKGDYFEKATDDNNNLILKYNFVDEPKKDGVYYYKLEGFNYAGNLIFTSDEIKIGISGIRDFDLEQNYPNPFNPSTTITYELYSNTHVVLKVFDLIGKEIATLVDQVQNSGQYSVEFDASKFSNLTSGIYFYKLVTDKYTDVKKMILTK